MENNNNWGRNVDTEEKFNDYPVALKIYETNNFTTSSSDEDDPYSLLRGKRFPKDEEPHLYTQEKFTLPPISLGIEAVTDLDEDRSNKEINNDKQDWKKCLEKRRHVEANLPNIIKKGQKSVGRPGTKFSVETKFNINNFTETVMECLNTGTDFVKHKGDLEMNIQNENVKIKRCNHLNSKSIEKYPDKAEGVGTLNGAKSLVERLVTHCRALALEQLHPKDDLMKALKKETTFNRDTRKICSIWDWKPKKENSKVGSKLDTNNLKIPLKMPNFVKLFKQFCTANCADMKIIIEDTVFHCHKIVLQCYSKFFQTHIRSKGYKKDVLIEIPHNKVNKNVFMDIYIWMLNSPKHCKNTFANHNILNLLIAAAFLKIDELEKHCWNYISDKKNFDESTAFDLYWEARHSSYWPVMQLMISRIKYFFLTLIQTDKFTTLSENELHLLLDSNNIAVHSEVEIFFSLILWLRKRNIPDPWECSLFRLIRFSQISPIQLVELQAMNELHYITKHYPISEMIENGLRTAIRREHALHANIDFNDPEPHARNWLRKTIVYKSFNDFIDNLLKKRSNMKKPNYELMRRETLEGLKLPSLQMWTPITRTSTA